MEPVPDGAPGGRTIDDPPTPGVDLYWIPLGADTSVVRGSGRVFEAVGAWWHRRDRSDLFHAALIVRVAEGRYVIEQAPVPDAHGERRGVVAGGPVGLAWLGRWRLFRYEVRRWLGGRIPDLHAAVGGPVRVSDDPTVARAVLDVLPGVPTPVWGRDELRAGEMWNSNAVVAWTLVRAGVAIESVAVPVGGRAPGWRAGIVVARRG